ADGSNTASASEQADQRAPTPPGSIESTERCISWSGKKGDLIVGYRIYDSNKDKPIGHTTDTSYTTPSYDGEYFIRAVNYFGQESDPSSKIKIKTKQKEEKKDKGKKKKKDKKKDD